MRSSRRTLETYLGHTDYTSLLAQQEAVAAVEAAKRLLTDPEPFLRERLLQNPGTISLNKKIPAHYNKEGKAGNAKPLYTRIRRKPGETSKQERLREDGGDAREGLIIKHTFAHLVPRSRNILMSRWSRLPDSFFLTSSWLFSWDCCSDKFCGSSSTCSDNSCTSH